MTMGPPRSRIFTVGFAVIIIMVLFYGISVRQHLNKNEIVADRRCPVDPRVDALGLTLSENMLSLIKKASPNGLDPAKCKWKFANYQPSSWELKWKERIAGNPRGVSAMLLEPEESKRAFHFISLNWEFLYSTEELKKAEVFTKENVEMYSSMKYNLVCDGKTVAKGEHLIEPLIGHLRDPLFRVFGGEMPYFPKLDCEANGVQSKRFILPAGNAPLRIGVIVDGKPVWGEWEYLRLAPWLHAEKAHQKILIDAGSSYFTGWEKMIDGFYVCESDALGGQWIMKHSIEFDRIFAYEHTVLDPQVLWNQVPESLFNVYTPINHGVCAEKDCKFNPLRLISRIAKEDDFVVMKLDIDTNPIEVPLVEEILEGFKGVERLIDEFYFEHHVSLPEMDIMWQQQNSPQTLIDSYRYFTTMREKGIRAHSWP